MGKLHTGNETLPGKNHLIWLKVLDMVNYNKTCQYNKN